MATTRRYIPADRTWVEPLVGTAAIGAKGNHIEIVEDGADRAVAVWHESGDNTPVLGVVEAVPPRRDMFYAAILAVIEVLVAKGYTTGTADIPDRHVMLLLKRGLGDAITITPVGRNVKTGEPGYWQIDVDPVKVLPVLRGLV